MNISTFQAVTDTSAPFPIRVLQITFIASMIITLIGFFMCLVILVAAIWNINCIPTQREYLLDIFLRIFATSIIVDVVFLTIIVAYYRITKG